MPGDWIARNPSMLLETVSLPKIWKTKLFLRSYDKRGILGDDAGFAYRIAEGRFLVPSSIGIWLMEVPISNR